MTNAGLERHPGDTRLIRINLPWMKIEHAGLLVVPQNNLQVPFEQRVREQPEIAAAASRPVGAQSSHRRDRYLDELAVLERVKREARLLGYSIEIVPDRDRTGAV